MKSLPHPLDRRDFLRMTGALGLGAFLAKSPLNASPASPGSIALRPFGKSGIKVPELAFGAMFDTLSNLPLLQEVYAQGITYWDTAASYAKGKSELGIGEFLKSNPGAREKLFLVTKASGGHAPEEMSRLLDQSLSRMGIASVDLYLMHGMSQISQVDRPEVKAWAEAKKREGKIKLFGFSTHANMEPLMLAASQLGWIDGIMTTFNYRVMENPAMKEAVAACTKAGIGLTAMKVIATGQRRNQPAASTTEDKVLEPIIASGLSPAQAKLKVVLSNREISTACVQLPNMQYLREAHEAATDGKPLAATGLEALRRHAELTRSDYCAGCSRLCEGALCGAIPVRDLLRCQMYQQGYGQTEEAHDLLSSLPREALERLSNLDLAEAEAACPNRLPIAKLLKSGGLLA